MKKGIELDPWAVTGFSTDKIRDAAHGLANAVSKIELPSGERNENDTILMRAIEALAIAADRIDRLDGQTDPVIVQISVHGTDDTLDMYGVDNVGRVWQYKFTTHGSDSPTGWLKMAGNVTQWPKDTPTPLKKVPKLN